MTEVSVSELSPPAFPGGMRIDVDEETAVLEALRSKRLFRYYGPQHGPSTVEQLEQTFADRIGARHCLAVSCGTAALTASLAALGAGPGDEVIVPAYSFIAIPAAVLAMGAVPVLAEVDESLTLDPADVERRITPKTKAVVAVHMRGAPAAMSELIAVTGAHGVRLIEDVAQAMGGSYQGRPLGRLGDIGAYSLQFNKIITSGEGGLLVTDHDRLHQRALMYHDVNAGVRNGISEDDVILGVNLRMSELQGAVAGVQLRKLDGIIQDMRVRKSVLKEEVADAVKAAGARFRRINCAVGDTGAALVVLMPDDVGADRVVSALRKAGLVASRMFTVARRDNHVYYHWSSILSRRSWSSRGPWDWHDGGVSYSREMCPRTLEILGRAVHLDVSPDLTDDQLDRTAKALHSALVRA